MAVASGLASIQLRTRAIVIVLLSMLVPISARANSSSILNLPSSTCVTGVGVCVQNTGGTANGGTGGFTMTGANASTLVEIGNVMGSNLGTLELTTGALQTGNINGMGAGATFAPGTLTITNTTAFGGFTGVLFNGTFSNISWKFEGKANNEFLYVLSGQVTGTWEGSLPVSGVTTQIFFKSKKAYTGGLISLADGSTFIVTPEPGTLSLMGTGLIGLAGLVKRRLVRDKAKV